MPKPRSINEDRLISVGVRNLLEFGYPGVTDENIFSDMVFAKFFRSMLEDNRGKGLDRTIQGLIDEIDAAHPKDR